MAKKKKVSARAQKFMREMRKQVKADIRAAKKAAFDTTTLEQRREFIRSWHEGKTIGEARTIAGIATLDAALEVLVRNTKKVTHEFVVPVEKVV